MASSAEQVRKYNGPAILGYGFRPFFLLAAAWAAAAVPLWLLMLLGKVSLPTRMAPLEWHIHELLYGYVPAVIAGFLLSAVPNWTGRLPVVGRSLLVLVLAWVAGRVAILASSWIGAAGAAVIDLGFLFALAFVVAREIVAGSNWRNLKILVILGLLILGNGLFHLEAASMLSGGYGTRLGIGATLMLIMLIGGRVVPSFTRNWLVRRGEGRLPIAFDTFDKFVMAASAVALTAWLVLPVSLVTAAAAIVAGLLNLVRLARWAGERTTAEPLVLVLHVAYTFIPLGFLLLVLAIVKPGAMPASGAIHAWTAGAISHMTLAIMTRASLGHTGQPLTAGRGVQLIYAAAFIAAITRIMATIWPEHAVLLHVSATAWLIAFGAFLAIYFPLLTRRR